MKLLVTSLNFIYCLVPSKRTDAPVQVVKLQRSTHSEIHWSEFHNTIHGFFQQYLPAYELMYFS